LRKLAVLTIGAVALLGVALAASGHPAWSQGARTIRVIISVPPGGSIDLLVRILADHISTAKGQSIIVESRPGAGGVIAAEAVARAPPDGTTLLVNNNGMIISSILRKVNYDPQASFEPICYLVTTPQVIVVHHTSPYRTLAELVDAARARPGELSIASVGPNTTQHIGIERFKRLAQVDLTYVPYPGGAPTVNALLGAHVTSAVLNWSEIGEQLTAGKVRALATMALQRIEPLPDLPTVSESATRISRPTYGSGWWRPPGHRKRRWRSSSIGSARPCSRPRSSRSSPRRRSIPIPNAAPSSAPTSNVSPSCSGD
jgi:tripartite-type tricarboxylate transporter receptor subunit TctC